MNLDFMNFISQTFSSISFFILVILLSGVIFVNGFSDAPNAIATCVSTRAISPKKALFMSGIFTFLGILIMSYINASVAHTIFNLADFGTETKPAIIALSAALISIISWATLAGKIGVPTSESHALIAALTGAAIALSNTFSVVNGKEWIKVFLGIGVSIILGAFVRLCNGKDNRVYIQAF